MSLAAGTRLGPYEIVAPLGQGGMGQVWRARDTRLGREVAIKVLAPHLTAQPEVRTRFEREARAISSLNHPNICVLHDVGREGDTDYLVMELVEGETLARKLQRGPMPVAEALATGAQIADALERAHRAGIVHRDLKPGNVMMTRGGAKLMDFGLARSQAGPGGTPFGGPPSSASASPTMSRPLTAEGSIVGTFQYMSPEQLEGAEADARSDIWALGCVLYEMVTGRPAFEGRSTASLISSIMKEEPPPISASASQAGTTGVPPPELDRLVRRCLAKNPDDRWQSAGDLKHEIQWVGGLSTSGATSAAGVALPPASTRPRRRLGGVIALVALVIPLSAILSAVVSSRFMSRRGTGDVVRFEIVERAGLRLKRPAEATMSPEGSRIAFVGEDSTGTTRLYVRPLNSTEVRQIPGVDDARLPFWSPGARSLGFFGGGNLLKVSLEGGAPVVLCDAPDGRGASWSPSGDIVFAPLAEGPIRVVRASGGESRVVAEPNRAAGERSLRYPRFLPDGRHFLYVGIRPSAPHAWYVGDVTGAAPRLIGEGETAPVWSGNGNVVWFDKTLVKARGFSPGSGKLSKEISTLASGAFTDNFGYSNLTVAGDLLFLQRSRPGPVRLVWKRPGKPDEAAFPEAIPADGDLALSHDGRRIVYETAAPPEFWLQDLDGGTPIRLTSDGVYKSTPVWSPDDRKILYGKTVGSGGYEARLLDLTTGTDTVLARTGGLFAIPTSWSPDGRLVLIAASDSTGQGDVWIVPTDGSAPARPLRRTPETEAAGLFSPNGQWIAMVSSLGDRSQLVIEPYPSTGVRYTMAGGTAVYGEWSPSGNSIVSVEPQGEVRERTILWGPPVRLGATRVLYTQGLGITAGGFSRSPRGFLQTLRDDSQRSVTLEGVLHWTRLLERR